MSPAAERPALLVFAGPNGSGKTTLKEWLERQGNDFARHINPDEIALALPGDDAVRMRAAQIRADQERSRFLADRLPFSFETVMSHPSKVEFMRQAKAAGYIVVLHFAGVEDHSINVARVADRVYVFDHSGMGSERRLCSALDEDGLKVFGDPVPAWVRRYFVEPMEARNGQRRLRNRPHSG